MTNNKKSYQLSKGIRITPTYRKGRLVLEFTNQGGAKCAFTLPTQGKPRV